MDLIVFGRCGPFPAPGCACSGYLLRCGNKNLLLDLGSGTFQRLYGLLPKLNIDCVVLSHLHSDHMSDMLVFRYALAQLSERGECGPLPMPVIAPDEPREEFRMLASSGVFDLTAIRDGARIRLDDITITTHRMTHPIPSYAIVVDYGGKRLFYTGDTGMRHDLVQLCSGADLLLADVCYLNQEAHSLVSPHLTAEQAGHLAAAAGVDMLVCSHVWGGRADTTELLRQARVAFPKAVVAEEMATYPI